MKYIIEIELPDNDTIREGITYKPVEWAWGGYSGYRRAMPVPKGKWIDSGSGWKCSNCGFQNEWTMSLKHCPECCADMREGEE